MNGLPIGRTPGAERALATMHHGDLAILGLILRYAALGALHENKSALAAEAMEDARRVEGEVSRRAHAATLARGAA